MKIYSSQMISILLVFALLMIPSAHSQPERTPRPTLPPKTDRPTVPPRTDRPTAPPKTPRPTGTMRPTLPPKTDRPTVDRPGTSRPTLPRTSRPTKLRTSRPTKDRTPRPTKLRTKRPTIDRTPRPTRTRRPTRERRADKPTEAMDCYEIEGNPAIIRGDPHTTTFAGVNHDFQGLPGDGLDQFYYIYPCADYDHNDLPYHMIGRHLEYKTKQVATLDYLVLELFEENGDEYVVFFSSGIHEYAKSDNTNYGTVTGTATLTSGETTSIGSRFQVNYVQTDTTSISVILTVDGECDLKFTMIAQNDYNSDLERYTMHYVRVNPPECYKCAVCGLLGDFQGDEMQTCDGSTTVAYGDYTNAWDERGWTWETTYAKENCGVSYTTTTLPPGATPSPTTKYIPPPDPTFEYDPCNDESSSLKIASTNKCNAARSRSDVNECCNKIGSIFCDDLMKNCPFDACFTSEGQETNLEAQIYQVLVDPILAECDELIIDEENYDTKTPTSKPTDLPPSCCKDQQTEQECLDNYLSGKMCLWIPADAPMAIKFNTQCLGKSLIENGPMPAMPGFSGDNPITDICHPQEVGNRVEVDMSGSKVKNMTGYAPQFQMFVALASVASVLVILGLISMFCQKGKEDKYQPISDPKQSIVFV